MSQTMEQMDTGSVRESEEEPQKKEKSRRPPNTAFRQQRLKAWQPILTPKTVLPLFFAVGIIFAPIGGLLLWTSAKVQEIAIDYSNCNTTAPACVEINGRQTPPSSTDAYVPNNKVTTYFKNSTDRADHPTWCTSTTTDAQTFGGARTLNSTICHVQFYLPDHLRPPVLLYYQLTNFYQNHRRYVKSFDQDQLKGQARDASAINGSDCSPLEGEVASDGTWKPYYPCGLIANSRFNDTIQNPVLVNSISSSANYTEYNMTTKGTAWASDADLYGQTSYSYGDVLPPPNWREVYQEYNSSTGWPDLNGDDHFQTWMRTAGLPTFSKLYLRNDNETMPIGRYQIDIYDYFPVTEYDGTKSILISTRTVMGGKNPFLGIAYVVVGGLCILLGALFTVTQLVKPRKLGDHSYLSWNNDSPATATTTGRAPRPGESA
ncbi:LEM3 (ligand-effect modulator 3) family / CDC50 family [Teratosphaeria destructans]|uniref:LEM3 (Ligand-effect modulator 3) family / CDC50 family n=1 Tax=Teratosphaeria destructans TaxID=418781 RepID=A0A9W7T0J3_9PEZI|nr:LEM3 (ligand-effect modulator 3) family / CDC50 family [Teratosphaeria destructans]